MLPRVMEPPAGSVTIEEYALQRDYTLSEGNLRRIKVIAKFWLFENYNERPTMVYTRIKREDGGSSYNVKYYYQEHMQIALAKAFETYIHGSNSA